METEKKVDNLDLWKSVAVVPEDFTKKVKHRGGFTSVDAAWLNMTATDLWGPQGGKWGLRDIKRETIYNQGVPEMIIMDAVLYYPGGEIEMINDCKYEAGNECYKKLRTNTLNKALSQLGFAANIYLGLFDDDINYEGRINIVKEKYNADELNKTIEKGADDESK